MNRRDFIGSLALLPAAWRWHAGWQAHSEAGGGYRTPRGLPLDEPAGVIAADAIPVCKIAPCGYAPAARKLATITAARPAAHFTLHPAGRSEIVFRGTLSDPAFDADSGDRVQFADFSAFRRAGQYQLRVAGAPPSEPFEIGENIYRRPLRLASRFFYGQRCGTEVAMAGEFAAYRHAACHLDAAFHFSSGRSGTCHNRGGWHDAGDYGRYIVNSGITTATLLWTVELFGGAVSALGLDLPESGGRMPDLLHEIRWNLDWMLTLADADGGVWHKQTSTVFCPFVMPEDDHLVSFIIGSGTPPYKTTGATADLAAVAAIAARVYAPYDPAYAARCLASARRAWTWLEKYPDQRFRNPPGISTGAYGDAELGDECLWAATELWRATGEDRYQAYFLARYAPFVSALPRLTPPGWGQTAALGLWSYALAEPRGGRRPLRPQAAAQAAIRQASLAAADELARRAANGYRTPLRSRDYVWGSNGVVANYAFQLLLARRFQARREYLETALDCLHYLLGRNPLGFCYVTHVAPRGVQRPHHRPSVADGLAAPWPGMLSGGPNAARGDAAMRKFVPAGTPPAKSYIDNHAAYSCNEVAINWNAPLVFALAGALAEI